MATAEVEGSRYSVRLARAVLLLAAGTAVHVWLFPAVSRSMHSPLRHVTATTSGAVGTSGVSEDASTASTVGDLAAAETRAARNAVKVIVTAVRPAIFRAPELISTPPLRMVTASLPAALGPETAEPSTAARADELTRQSTTLEAAPAADGGQSRDTAEIDVARSASREPKVVPAADVRTASATSARPPVSGAERMRTLMDRPAAPEVPSDERLVSAVLQQYRAAYESLDVSAAQTVWPSVDARALSAAFRQLAGQRVTFESCGVSVSGSGAQATARCHGQAEYLPKVGGRRAFVASGEWVFDLAKQDAAWRIVNAEATIK